MDFLDPKKQRHHEIRLLVGYAFVGIAILIATYLLLNVAYGFGRGNNGQLVQNGFLYLSSNPAGATIRVNGKLQNSKTNARLSLPEGTYHIQLDRTGYQSWSRDITLVGGSVNHYDYPLLVPKQLTTSTIKSYDTAPLLATQTPDQRWLLTESATDQTQFDEYDLKNPKAAAVVLALPASLISAGTTQSWEAMEWASDNDHLLLKHVYDGTSEFIVLDRSDPTKSINLNQQLAVTPTKVSLRDKKYDQYYLYNSDTQLLQTASLDDPTPKADLDHVLEYQSYGPDMLLYASSAAASTGKVSIDLLQDGKTYNLREVSAGTTYLLNMTKYSGAWIVAIGASSENKVYVYKNPVTQLNSNLGVPVPVSVLKTTDPTYLAFSDSAQFIMSESGSQFAVYDAEMDETYTYDTKAPLDAPQAHAAWMDGDRLTYVSNGKLLMFDYDHANLQTLTSASSSYLPFFDPNSAFVDTLSPPNTAGQTVLSTTPLRTAADQ